MTHHRPMGQCYCRAGAPLSSRFSAQGAFAGTSTIIARTVASAYVGGAFITTSRPSLGVTSLAEVSFDAFI